MRAAAHPFHVRRVRDTAATALYALALAQPFGIDGRPVTDAFRDPE
jgi:hypothetical protein